VSPLEQLDLYLNDSHLAVLHEAGMGYASLTYDPEVVNAYGEGAVLLSLGLPIQAAPYPGVETRAFLEGLLPEENNRDVLADELRLDRGNVFGLLRELGLDMAGAVVITGAGEPIPPRAPSVLWLTDDELVERINNLPYAPLGVDREGEIRLSLAGVQDKLAIVRDDAGRIGLPKDGHPTTDILKPPSTRRDREGELLFPHLAENEAYCMRVAAHAGLSAASVEIHRPADGQPCVIVTRFDRREVDGVVQRIHQEDACQALRIPPERKYEEHGGPSLGQIAGLLGAYSTSPLPDLLALLDQQVLHVLVGNTDAHGKNVSFLYEEGGIRLAPLYDVVSTRVYLRHSRYAAMTIGGELLIDDVDLEAFQRAYEECDLTAELATRRVPQVVARILKAADAAHDEAQTEGWDETIIGDIHQRIAKVARRLVPDATRVE
jgi:serine/threonine-protein kinase HipA